MDASTFRLLTDPQSVAVVGVPRGEGHSYAGRLLIRNVMASRIQRRVYPVNPNASGELFGLPSFKSLRDVPETPDLTLILVPPSSVPSVLDDVAHRGARAAIVLTAHQGEGAAEAGKFDKVVALKARDHGLTVIGPNSVGIVNGHADLLATFASGAQALVREGRSTLSPGPVSVISQSGGLIGFLLQELRSREIGCAYLASTGNEACVGVADLLEHVAVDDHTSCTILFLEALADIGHLRSGLAAAREHEQRVVVFVVGATDAGRAAAQSHSGRITGSRAPYDALIDEYSLIEARSYNEVFDLAYAADRVRGQYLRGQRAAIVSNSGGLGVYSVDQVTKRGWITPEMSEVTKARLAEVQVGTEEIRNPLDLTGLASNPDLLAKALNILDASNEYDCLFVTVGIGGSTSDQRRVAEELVDLTVRGVQTPFVLAWLGLECEVMSMLERAGMTVFSEPLRAITAVSSMTMLSRSAQRIEVPARVGSEWLPLADSVGADRNPRRVTANEPALATGASVFAELEAFGVRAAPFELVEMGGRSMTALASAAQAVGFPVALKLDSTELLHKSERGAVITNISSEASLKLAAASLAKIADQDSISARYLIQKMIPGVEVLVGGKRDVSAGVVLVIGLGGVLAELMSDSKWVLLPTTRERLTRAVYENERLSTLLSGYRGQPASDSAALVRLLEGVSDWAVAQRSSLLEFDLNPVAVTPSGSFVLDGRIVRQQ